MDSRVHALYKIDAEPQGPALARRIIADELSSRVPARVLDDIKLMVSELVTNGIVHGAARDGNAPVMLELCVSTDVLCRVLDRGPGFAARASHQTRGGGWGLRVVQELADRWGVECSPHRTEVWFERECA